LACTPVGSPAGYDPQELQFGTAGNYVATGALWLGRVASVVLGFHVGSSIIGEPSEGGDHEILSILVPVVAGIIAYNLTAQHDRLDPDFQREIANAKSSLTQAVQRLGGPGQAVYLSFDTGLGKHQTEITDDLLKKLPSTRILQAQAPAPAAARVLAGR
jgi:hypothetical protein